MYVPKHFEEPRVDLMHGLIRARPLATLVTLASTGLNANHIPLQLLESPAPLGTLRGHVARANPILDDLTNEIEALAVFHGPDTYITPSWYATKEETGKVVPTWNYVVVHAYGSLRAVSDSGWLRTHVGDLTAQHEAAFAEPWTVAAAPQEHIDRRLAAIVGLEMVITRLLGKWKVSQSQPPQNKVSVVAGLTTSGLPGAQAMAELVAAKAKNT